MLRGTGGGSGGNTPTRGERSNSSNHDVEIDEEERQGLLRSSSLPQMTSASYPPPISTAAAADVASAAATRVCNRTSRTPKTLLLLLGIALLGYPFLADHVYLWMVTNEISVMLMPASRRSCVYPALSVPFEEAIGLTASLPPTASLLSSSPTQPPSRRHTDATITQPAAATADPAADTEEPPISSTTTSTSTSSSLSTIDLTSAMPTTISDDFLANASNTTTAAVSGTQPPSLPLKASITLVAVMDRRPDSDLAGSNTPIFKRLSNKLMSQSLEQQRAYASFWGYDHLLWEGQEEENANLLGGRPVAWGKLLALQQALENYDYALYLDLDIAIIQPLLSLEGYVGRLEGEEKDFMVAEDGNGVNTGVMLVRKSEWSKWFLRELWRVGESLVTCDCIFYYEQRAFHHALQTEQWQKGLRWWTRHIPLVGWFQNPLRGHPPGPSLQTLPLFHPNHTPVASSEEIWQHVEIAPQCAFNAVDSLTDSEFIVHFAGQKGRRKEKLMDHYGKIAQDVLENVANPLRERLRDGGREGGGLPVVHQTWKTHVLEGAKLAWHMSWRRNGFRVQLRNDTECLDDIERLCLVTGETDYMRVYSSLNPVQRADFWRYAITWLEGGIYADIDIGATPETARFFMERWQGGGKRGGEGGGKKAGTALVGIIENVPYDNFLGRMHWKGGMSPMYSRLPQLRQSFFYARKGHPGLLRLMDGIRAMVRRWEESGHTDLGRAWPKLSAKELREMEASGALTLEMTGPGVWTDYMLTPLLHKKGRARRREGGEEGEEELEALRASSVVLGTMEGYSLIRYGSMGSWKTDAHKADSRMWRNLLLFYLSPLLLALSVRCLRRRQRRGIEAKRRAREGGGNGLNGGGGISMVGLGIADGGSGGLPMTADRDKVH